MSQLPSLAAVKAENAKISFPYLPVAIFVGGTSGIGRGIAEAFARHTKGNAHIILVGRNRSAAESIIASFPQATSPDATHEFISCDVTLLKNVRETVKEILARHAKVNFLVLSPGVLDFTKEITEEGILRSTTLRYYSRWKFIYDLIPALSKARDDHEDAKVLSVLSAGNGSKIDLDDLELKKASSISAVRSIISYNDIMMDGFAFHFPSISFIHCYPGWVHTPLGSNSPSFLGRAVYYLLMSPFSPLPYFLMSPEDCGEYQLYGITYTASTPGAWRIGSSGNNIGKKGYYGDNNARDILWEHTMKVTGSS